MRYIQGLIGILIIANLILSASLVYYDYKGSAFCITGKSCEEVQNSQYGTLLGIKLSWLGIIAFTTLLILFYLSQTNKIQYNLYLGVSLVGAFLSAYFLYLQFIVLNKVCSTCFVVDTITIIIFILSLFNKK